MTEKISTVKIDREKEVLLEAKQIIHLLFSSYAFLILIRIVLSYFPSLHRYRVFRMVFFYTNPYLNLFQRLIPPIGGVLDLSPMAALLSLRLGEALALKIL
ncbi:MAG: YggT family protein [Verrucomicrobia bacterium]|nr:YggT family protein [Verrucomicrobiota bacterium]